ncbi:MAG: nucleolar RNA-binding Nop10p family protein [Candidatus Woesearchaeota archaeon]
MPILFCPKCSIYTLERKCKKCSGDTYEPKPAKYSPEDKFGDYRRKAKLNEYKEKGLF